MSKDTPPRKITLPNGTPAIIAGTLVDDYDRPLAWALVGVGEQGKIKDQFIRRPRRFLRESIESDLTPEEIIRKLQSHTQPVALKKGSLEVVASLPVKPGQLHFAFSDLVTTTDDSVFLESNTPAALHLDLDSHWVPFPQPLLLEDGQVTQGEVQSALTLAALGQPTFLKGDGPRPDASTVVDWGLSDWIEIKNIEPDTKITRLNKLLKSAYKQPNSNYRLVVDARNSSWTQDDVLDSLRTVENRHLNQYRQVEVWLSVKGELQPENPILVDKKGKVSFSEESGFTFLTPPEVDRLLAQQTGTIGIPRIDHPSRVLVLVQREGEQAAIEGTMPVHRHTDPVEVVSYPECYKDVVANIRDTTMDNAAKMAEIESFLKLHAVQLEIKRENGVPGTQYLTPIRYEVNAGDENLGHILVDNPHDAKQAVLDLTKIMYAPPATQEGYQKALNTVTGFHWARETAKKAKDVLPHLHKPALALEIPPAEIQQNHTSYSGVVVSQPIVNLIRSVNGKTLAWFVTVGTEEHNKMVEKLNTFQTMRHGARQDRVRAMAEGNDFCGVLKSDAQPDDFTYIGLERTTLGDFDPWKVPAVGIDRVEGETVNPKYDPGGVNHLVSSKDGGGLSTLNP